MTLSTGLMIANVALAAIGTAASVVASVDQIKNADRRAAITGTAAGQAIAQHAQDNNWYVCCGVKISPDGKIIK